MRSMRMGSGLGRGRRNDAHVGRSAVGQALTEFALILPVLILLMLIVLDFGRLFMSYVTMNNLVRMAANYGATDPDAFTGTPNLTTYNAILARESGGLNCTLRADGAGNNPPIPTYPGGTDLGQMSIATMTCDFGLITPVIGQILGNSLPISVTAQYPIRTGAIENISGSTTLPPPGSPVADFDFIGVSGGTVDGSGNVTGMGPITVNFQDQSSNAQTWLWDFGDGTTYTLGPNPPAHAYPDCPSGCVHTVRLRVTNPVGQSTRSHTITQTASAGPPPVADFYGTPVGTAPDANGGGSSGAAIFGSIPLTVNFTNTSTNATAWSWNFGDGSAASTVQTPSHQYNTLGIYTVTLTITAPTGGTPSTRANYITVGCVVPNFAGSSVTAAGATWTGAHFTGTIRYRQSGNNGNGNPNPPGSGTITGQTIAGGTFEVPTKQGSNPYRCDNDIIVDYQ